MKNWLIKILGGYTFDQVDKAEREASDLTNQIEKGISFLQEQLERKDQEIARLTDLMLFRGGFLAPELASTKQAEERPQPINRRPSWKTKQRELEQEDAKRAVDQIERNWRNKSGAMSSGDGTDEGEIGEPKPN